MKRNEWSLWRWQRIERRLECLIYLVIEMAQQFLKFLKGKDKPDPATLALVNPE